jgi:hypothetical protein
MASTVPEQPRRWPHGDEVPIEDLARQQGVHPVTDLATLAHPDAWESEQKFQDFLADLHASRHSETG